MRGCGDGVGAMMARDEEYCCFLNYAAAYILKNN